MNVFEKGLKAYEEAIEYIQAPEVSFEDSLNYLSARKMNLGFCYFAFKNKLIRHYLEVDLAVRKYYKTNSSTWAEYPLHCLGKKAICRSLRVRRDILRKIISRKEDSQLGQLEKADE